MLSEKTIHELSDKPLSKNSTRKTYDVREATVILQQFGLSHNEKKTRDLISKNKLKARSKGDENDRRSGYEMTEKALYDFVVGDIPILKKWFDEILEYRKLNDKNQG